LLLGKRTYDIFSAYWPYNQDNPIGEKFQRINKYVLTHSTSRSNGSIAKDLSWRYCEGSGRTQAD
jgi:dihydrofolate reductase